MTATRLADPGTSWRVLAVIQLAVPMLAAGSFFVFRSAATDLNNPDLPLAFRLGKDVAFLAVVFMPLYLVVIRRGLILPFVPNIYWLVPIFMGLLMLMIGGVKGGPSFLGGGPVRNIAFYYFGGGAIAALAWWLGYQPLLFRTFRALMAGSVLLGVYFYLFKENILLYTIHFRMIGTLGNPNFLGFLCVIWIAMIPAVVAGEARLRLIRVAELSVAMIGLLGSASMAAMLTLVAWALLVGLMRWRGWLPGGAALTRFLTLAAVAGGTIAVVGALWLAATAPELFQIARRVQALDQSQTVSVRLADYHRLWADFARPPSLLVGQSATPRYVQFDGSNPSVLYNLGIPFFLLWTSYFLFPVMVAWRSRHALLARGGLEDRFVLFLAPLLLVAFGIEYSLQYIPEMYPPCVILGWLMMFVVLRSNDSLDNGMRRGAE
jgi:hypothetical protein